MIADQYRAGRSQAPGHRPGPVRDHGRRLCPARARPRLIPGFHIHPALLIALCCAMLIAAAGAACVTGGAAEPPTPTPDFEATIRAAVAQAVAPTATPTVAPTPSPTSTPRPTPTPREAATTSSSPSPPTFGPRPTPTPQSPLSDFDNGDYLERHDPKSATTIKTLPWVADGIAQAEKEPLQELLYLATSHPSVFRSLMGLT